MVWTQEDIEKVKKFIDIKRRGHYAETHELTSVYNRVLQKNVSNTTCGSCLRQRVEELERALRKYEADKAKAEEIKAQEAAKNASETTKQPLVENTPEETKEAVTEQINEELSNGDNTKPHKTKGRKKKSE